jgi:hypothetical protein
MKRYDLYSWQDQDLWCFALVVGMNRLKTFEEVSSSEARVTGVGALKSEVIVFSQVG